MQAAAKGKADYQGRRTKVRHHGTPVSACFFLYRWMCFAGVYMRLKHAMLPVDCDPSLMLTMCFFF